METLDDLAGVRGTSTDDPSGAARAREAHEAGAVLPTVELPTFDVTLAFRVHAPQRDADELAQGLSGVVAQHPTVLSPVSVTVARREP